MWQKNVLFIKCIIYIFIKFKIYLYWTESRRQFYILQEHNWNVKVGNSCMISLSTLKAIWRIFVLLNLLWPVVVGTAIALPQRHVLRLQTCACATFGSGVVFGSGSVLCKYVKASSLHLWWNFNLLTATSRNRTWVAEVKGTCATNHCITNTQNYTRHVKSCILMWLPVCHQWSRTGALITLLVQSNVSLSQCSPATNIWRKLW